VYGYGGGKVCGKELYLEWLAGLPSASWWKLALRRRAK
jgi:hypothetical protein